MNDFLATDEAAAILGVSSRRVRAMIAAGQLPNTQRIGSGKRAVHLIARADLDLVKDRKSGRPPKAPPKPRRRKKQKGK